MTNTNTMTTNTEVTTRIPRLRNDTENEYIRDLREQATVEIRNEQYNIPRLPTDENNTGDREADFLNLLKTDVGTEEFRRNLTNNSLLGSIFQTLADYFNNK